MKIGKIFPAGVGPKSSKRQLEALKLEGIDECRIGENQEEFLRDGDTLYVIDAYLLATDCAGLAKWYREIVLKGADLYIIETGSTFSGMPALPDLIQCWQDARRRVQTYKARQAQAGRKKQGVAIIKTPSQRREFRRLWADPSNSVAKLAAMYGVTGTTIHRARRQLRLPKRDQ